MLSDLSSGVAISNAPRKRTAETATTAANPVTFVAMLAPPVSGNTAVSTAVLKRLKQDSVIRVCNLSPKVDSFNTSYKIGKLGLVIVALWRILTWPMPRDAKLYAVADDGFGQFYTIAFAVAARLRGYKLLLQHHSYKYIRERDWRMAIVDKSLRPNGLHAFLCCQQAKDFHAQYGDQTGHIIMPSTIALPQQDHDSLETDALGRGLPETKRFHLGMISILMMDKGIDTAAKTFETLKTQGHDVVLHLAGPFSTPVEKVFVENLVAKHDAKVNYWGPVYGDDKKRFFESLDVLLFPTRYKTEAQPVVIAEAFSHGVPVLANRRACIQSLIDGADGSSSIPEQQFISHASGVIAKWIMDRDAHREAQHAALRRAISLREDATRQMTQLTELLNGHRPWPTKGTSKTP